MTSHLGPGDPGDPPSYSHVDGRSYRTIGGRLDEIEAKVSTMGTVEQYAPTITALGGGEDTTGLSVVVGQYVLQRQNPSGTTAVMFLQVGFGITDVGNFSFGVVPAITLPPGWQTYGGGAVNAYVSDAGGPTLYIGMAANVDQRTNLILQFTGQTPSYASDSAPVASLANGDGFGCQGLLFVQPV